ALDDGRFELFYQPIVEVAAVRAESFPSRVECLLRMISVDGARISPSEFFPAAERYSLAQRLDRWVVRHACEWFAENKNLLRDLEMVSLNLSGAALSDQVVLGDLAKEVARFGIPLDQLCFEITETSAITNLNVAIGFMNDMRSKGCRFALDDFGSGLSSFGYLRSLPIDLLKIDGSFIRDIATDAIDRAMVKSINEVGHVMGKKTVAEFVESEAIFERIAGLGVDYAQGYHFGEPQPLDTLSTFR
ncbi:MAG: EAL domain-containing protein, partial [Gammaproteobacteria bacterium]|nr:EAL domain-containing protein [Gammaproteobacteria bacterium]